MDRSIYYVRNPIPEALIEFIQYDPAKHAGFERYVYLGFGQYEQVAIPKVRDYSKGTEVACDYVDEPPVNERPFEAHSGMQKSVFVTDVHLGVPSDPVTETESPSDLVVNLTLRIKVELV